ncbi:MAG: hypothetical protein JSR45_05490 [Proteobacteria bacterium]|nr:hypothetical protein [Pseudomonadota bacterium]
MTPDKTPAPTKRADEVELKRWHPQPEPEEAKSFEREAAGEPQPTTGHERKIHAPHAKAAKPLKENEKPDQLDTRKAAQAEDRQEALIDEGVEETFPASDPISVKRIT